jgi:TATA-box binding protein (TBP) (component of TFIID and TFIIIB)
MIDRKKIIWDSIERTVPLGSISVPCTEIKISNVVAKVDLLGPKETLCLESIALYWTGVVKYEPKKFAAVIIPLKDRIRATTGLLFNSGKLIIVGASTKHHSLYASQVLRWMVEQVPAVYRGPEGKLGLYNLENRILFDNWFISNFVGSCTLPYRPNLKVIVTILGELASWNPGLFPGLPLRIWLTPKSDCKCPKKKKNKPCRCRSTVLIFDTGKIVITGCRSFENINKTLYLLNILLSDCSMQDQSAEIPRHQRFEERRRKLVDLIEIDPKALTKMDLQTYLQDVRPVKRYKREEGSFMELAKKRGQEENVKFLEWNKWYI